MQKLEGRLVGRAGHRAVYSNGGSGLPGDIAGNLRQLRRRQGLSLEQLAQLSGVSRAMLGQIETGKSSPTVALLSKVASALGLPLAALLAEAPASRCRLLSKDDAQRIALSGGLFPTRQFTSFDAGSGAGFYELHLAPHHRQEAAGHLPDTRGCLAVSSGYVEMTVGGQPALSLGEGDAVLFDGGLAQVYFNPGVENAVAYLVLSLARNGHGLD